MNARDWYEVGFRAAVEAGREQLAESAADDADFGDNLADAREGGWDGDEVEALDGMRSGWDAARRELLGDAPSLREMQREMTVEHLGYEADEHDLEAYRGALADAWEESPPRFEAEARALAERVFLSPRWAEGGRKLREAAAARLKAEAVGEGWQCGEHGEESGSGGAR